MPALARENVRFTMMPGIVSLKDALRHGVLGDRAHSDRIERRRGASLKIRSLKIHLLEDARLP